MQGGTLMNLWYIPSLPPSLPVTSSSSFSDTACLPTDTMFISGGKRSGSSSYRVQTAHNTKCQIYEELVHPSSDHDYITGVFFQKNSKYKSNG